MLTLSHRRRIAEWLILGCSLLFFGGYLAYTLHQDYEQIQTEQRDRLITQTSVISKNLQTLLGSADRALESAIEEWQGGHQDLKYTRRQLQLICDTLGGIQSIVIIDKAGRVSASNKEVLIGMDLRYRDYFQLARQEANAKTLYVTPPFTTALNNYAIGLVRAMTRQNGEFSGAVIAIANPAYFKTLLDSVRYTSDARSSIVHGDGKLFMLEPEQPELNGTNLAVPGSLFSRHVDSKQPLNLFAEKTSLTGERRMIALRTVQPEGLTVDKPLVVSISRDYPAIFAGWNAQRNWFGIAFGGLALLSAGFLFLYQRRQRLAEQIVAEQEGKQQLLDADLRIAATAFKAHQGIVVTDAQGVILRVNEAFCDITGFSENDAVGRTMSFLKSGRQNAEFYTRMWERITSKGSWQGELWNRLRNGEIHPHLVTVAGVKAMDGSISHYVGTYTDITESKQVEAALQESYNALQGVLETTLDGYWCADSEGRLIDVNQTYCQQSGYTRDELLGMHIVDLEAKESHAETAVHIQQIIESGSDQFESQHRRKDGTLWHVEVSATYRAVAGGQFFVFVRDIDDRWQAQRKLRESELRMRAIIDNEPECIKIVDAKGLLRQMNCAGLAMIEAESIEQVAGRSLLEIIAPEYREAYAAMHEQVIAGETRQLEFEVIGLKGGRRWMETHATPMQDQGKTVHLAVTRDVTARKLVEASLRETENLNRAILNSVGTQIAVLDRTGVIIAVNEPWERFALENSPEPGQPAPGTGIGVNYLAVCQGRTSGATDGMTATRDGIQAVLDQRQSSFTIEYPCHSPTQQRWFSMSVTPLGAFAGGAVVAHTDITRRKRAEANLRIAATAFDSQEGMMVTDAHAVILRVNRAFTEITGYSAEELVGQTPRMLQSGRHSAEFFRAMWQTIKETGGWQGEIWDKRKNGEIYPKWLTISAVRNESGDVTNYVGTHYDITERKQAEERIEELAFFDQLTGLPNRTLLLDRLKQAMTSSTRSGNYGALLFIDLDNFKSLNDTQGHDVGDLLLKEVSLRLRQCVREGDTVARLGGDEFVVVLEDLSKNEQEAATSTESITEKILAKLNNVYQFAQVTHQSTASIGATVFKDASISVDELMKQADLTMYKAKEAGRNAVRFFDPAMEIAVKARAALENDLRRAVEAHEFMLHYQPQVVDNGRLTGAEVLVRWQHSERGMVSPKDFIPLAEETGLILPLGHWVLATACEQLARWAEQPAMRELTLSVNVSARQFNQHDFVDQVLRVLKQTGANPKRLKLELTESLLIGNLEEIIEKMFVLKSKGVGFSLDDFGTGYSSLSYLKRLPLDQLKIDQSFVRDVLVDLNDAAIARTVVALAQSLGLGVIAEGVETQAQVDFLANANCYSYQGYYFGKPMPIEGFEEFANKI